MSERLSHLDVAARREHRRRRFRRHRRRAYIRSVYSLPSLATLGNAICGFGAIYIAGLVFGTPGRDRFTEMLASHAFTVAAGLIFLAMAFDGIDGRLARFTRHTTDFGGQLDSLADVISFGVAPAILAIQVFKHESPPVPVFLSRAIWSVAALYMCCAAIRLARFNVSNEHGEQHHFSFLGLPSPGAGGTVAAWVLMQQSLLGEVNEHGMIWLQRLNLLCVWILPAVVLFTGLLMVSTIRYPHLINRYLRGKRSLRRLLVMLIIVLLFIIGRQYTLAIGMLAYSLYGVANWAWLRIRPRPAAPFTPLP